MSFVSGSNSALSSSSFFFSSSSSRSRPSLVVDFSFFPSNSLSCPTEYSSMGSVIYRTSSPARNEKQRAELELSLDAEVLHGQVVLPVVGQG